MITTNRTEQQKQFIQLRAQGKSYSDISAELGISKSSCSNWAKKYAAEIERAKKQKPADSGKAKRADYTFLHDWFGNTFKFTGTDKENPDYDIVEVMCSPYAMVNWALQYSDRVEVLEPENVRSAVIEKINALNTKYIEQEDNDVQ